MSMKQFLELGNRYAAESDWKDFALVKFCLFSMGVITGTWITPKHKKAITVLAASVFVATYIPLMKKIIVLGKEMFLKQEDIFEEDDLFGEK